MLHFFKKLSVEIPNSCKPTKSSRLQFLDISGNSISVSCPFDMIDMYGCTVKKTTRKRASQLFLNVQTLVFLSWWIISGTYLPPITVTTRQITNLNLSHEPAWGGRSKKTAQLNPLGHIFRHGKRCECLKNFKEGCSSAAKTARKPAKTCNLAPPSNEGCGVIFLGAKWSLTLKFI